MEFEEEFNDEIGYRLFTSYPALISKYGFGLTASKEYLGDLGVTLIYCMAKPAIVMTIVCVAVTVLFYNWVDIWTRYLVDKIWTAYGISLKTLGPWKCMIFNPQGDKTEVNYDRLPIPNEKWNNLSDRVPFSVGVYSMQGRRPHMEDRHLIDENVEKSGIALIGVFDGHGGQFAVDFITSNIIDKFRKFLPLNCTGKKHTAVEHKVASKQGSQSETTVSNCKDHVSDTCERVEASPSIDEENSVNKKESVENNKEKSLPNIVHTSECKPDFLKLLSDSIGSLDSDLIMLAKKNKNLSGSTALISLIYKHHLVVANVGDSRGVMCGSRGNVIPVSFDHKPQQVKEKERIEQFGGFVTYNGVWRVVGVLATSRALGDYPLKENKYVISEPDVLSFDLLEIKPKFVILATDGLWDVMRNEEAVSFILEHLDESDHGAKSLCLRAYDKGSTDNISALIITFPQI